MRRSQGKANIKFSVLSSAGSVGCWATSHWDVTALFQKACGGWGRAPRSCPYWAAARKRAKEKRRQPSVACAFPARGSAAAVNSHPWQLAAARAHRTVRAPARRGLLVGLPPSRPRKEKRNRTHRLTQPRPCTIMGTILTRGGLPYALQRV